VVIAVIVANIWRSYVQEFSVLFFFLLTVYCQFAIKAFGSNGLASSSRDRAAGIDFGVHN